MAVKTNGHCPQCNLNGENQLLVLNTKDYWECPKCKLQLQMLSEDFMGILLERGNGNLILKSQYHYEIWGDRTLLKKPIELFDSTNIENEEVLRSYLENISD